MARTIQDIHNEMLTAIKQDAVLSVLLTSTSKVSIYRLFTFIIAVSIWVLEQLFEEHKKEIDYALLHQKRGSKNWYRTMAINFQYGFSLVVDSDTYNNKGVTSEQIEASKIVKYSAVTEAVDSRVIIKIAGEKNEILQPISLQEKESFEAYIKEIKFAGVKTTVINYLPDRLYLDLKIVRDPLVLDAQGSSILEGGKPVEQAILNFLKNLPFDGRLILAHLTDSLQEVHGVLVPHINFAKTSWIDPTAGDYGVPNIINISTIPVSGYFTIVDFKNIEYVVQS